MAWREPKKRGYSEYWSGREQAGWGRRRAQSVRGNLFADRLFVPVAWLQQHPPDRGASNSQLRSLSASHPSVSHIHNIFSATYDTRGGQTPPSNKQHSASVSLKLTHSENNVCNKSHPRRPIVTAGCQEIVRKIKHFCQLYPILQLSGKATGDQSVHMANKNMKLEGLKVVISQQK